MQCVDPIWINRQTSCVCLVFFVGVSSNREAVKVSVPTQPSLSGNEGMRANDRGRELLLFLG